MTFVREFSESLAGSWSNLGGAVETVLSDDGVMQQVKVTVPAGSAGAIRAAAGNPVSATVA
jgi:hypothetical protein